VAQNTADFGILNAGSYSGDLYLLPYQRDELIVIAPKEHPLSQHSQVRICEALHYDFVGAHTGSAINALLNRSAAQLEMPLKLRIQVTSYDAMCLMVASGLGIGVLPRQSAALYTHSLPIATIDLAEPWAQRQLWICMRSYDALPPVAKVLVDHLSQPSAHGDEAGQTPPND
jgi:DNA-binding transcriptional LysR family regulator